MSTLLSIVGFAAQFCVITSFVAIVISSVCLRTNDSVFISEDRPSGAVVVVSVDDSDAALLDAARANCAKPIVSTSYTTTIDEPLYSGNDYSTLTIRQLKTLCKDRRIKGYSSLRKHELVALLSAF